jgi:hypothetical protein
MNLEDTACFPPLACRMLVNPAKRVETGEKPLRIPPFCEIDLKNWDGFYFSYLQWLGVKVYDRSRAKNRDIQRKPWEEKLILFHEQVGHRLLSDTPFSRLKRFRMLGFYALMLKIFKGGREKINVPLSRNKPVNELKERGKVLARLHKASELIEEVYAVRKSLLYLRYLGEISNAEWQEKTEEYKEAYDDAIVGFSIAYEIVDNIANNLGESIADALIVSVLSTGHPERAFWGLLLGRDVLESRVFPPEWALSPKETRRAADLSFDQVGMAIAKQLLEDDPDDSYYQIRKLTTTIAAREEVYSDWGSKSNGLEKFFSNASPTTMLYSAFSEEAGCPFINIMPEPGGDGIEEIRYGDYILVLEAIRQQLTQGIGVLCPFSAWLPGECCHTYNREFLECVWSCTAHNRSCTWKRMGCLRRRGTLKASHGV